MVIRSYLFHGAIEDCVADEIIMRNDIHKDMNIDYAAKIYNNIMNRQRDRQIVILGEMFKLCWIDLKVWFKKVK